MATSTTARITELERRLAQAERICAEQHALSASIRRELTHLEAMAERVA